uniref:RING-type domain-containing protein n=1 Tax=Ciona savignyi TaxID=51511 RepID=H2YTI1_CIOSA
MLTDSMISIFSIGSAVSVPLYYCGIKLHDFVGGADLEQAESLGTISAVLFCLLAVQTGLSGLPPLNRLLRLYRNACLLIAAVLHYMHDLVHPVLINLSAQVNISVKKHIKPLLVALVLLILPLCFSIWLVKTTPISTWLIAVTAFSIELIVKVVSTLMLYMLFAADARIDHKPWPHLDDWVFYVQATGHTIEFICGCVMFVNGAYVLIFESGSALRAFMMSMHAYVNIYKSAKEGLKTLYNRQTVNTRIAKLTQASPDILMDHTDDVCSICYQEFSNEFGDVRITNCEHLFHSTCLRKWLYIQDACPMCHQNIFKESKTE